MELMRDGRLLAEAIDGCSLDLPALTALLSGASGPGAAIVLGLHGESAAIAALLPHLDDDGLLGRAAAWALGRLGAEAPLRQALAEGGLDVRENAYRGLALIAGAGRATPDLAAAMHARIGAELERVARRLTGLGEHAARVLAALGDADTNAAIQRLVDGDPGVDRFELQRLRKAVADHGHDRETRQQAVGAWVLSFRDDLWQPPAPKPEPKPAAKPAAKGPGPALRPGAGVQAPLAARPAPAPAAAPQAAEAAPAPSADEAADDEALVDDHGEPMTAVPIDWEGFLSSPDAAGLQAPQRSLIAQVGPMLEQLAARGLGAPFTDLAAEELAGLLLQILPQAMQPQHLQMVLSPPSLNALQTLARFLERTGAATKGDALVQGIKLVRQQLAASIRSRGILGGPDYSDPDDATPAG
jgi:hypothetical protein